MIISVNWLKKYIKINVPIETLVNEIGTKLVEIESVTDLNQKYKDVLVVKVTSCQPHPKSDHLNILKINDGGKSNVSNRDKKGEIEIICGAPNVAKGQTVAWLPPKSIVPSTFDKEPFQLTTKKILGTVSHGMIASPKELDLYDDQNGILILPDEIKAGASFALSFELDDYLLNIENKSLTHRPDCFGVIGFAREVATILGQKFEPPTWFKKDIDFAQKNSEIKVSINDANLSQKYQVVTINKKGIEGLSFLQKTYLARIGSRPIDPIVDITNWVMFETGNPTHAFDYDKVFKLCKEQGLDGIEINVRVAKKHEKLKLLDGRDIKLTDKDIVISAGNQAIALAGAMGGNSTKIDHSTEKIILEVATFDLYKLRSTQMRYGIFSEAITRFTKGQPVGVIDLVTARTLGLMFDLENASLDYTRSFVENKLSSHRPIRLNYNFINQYLGTNLSIQAMTTMLDNANLSWSTEDNDIVVDIPWWRTDLNRRVELIEEIGRIYGYDNIASVLPTRLTQAPSHEPIFVLSKNIRQILSSVGANETLNYSFVPGKILDYTKQDRENSFAIINSISPDLEYYRQSILSSLLRLIHPNIKANYPDMALYEINKIHHRQDGTTKDNVPVEKNSLGFIIAKNKDTESAYYSAKKYVNLIAKKMFLEFEYWSDFQSDPTSTIFEPKRSAQIVYKNKIIGYVGEFSLSVQKAFKLPPFCAGFEINLDNLLQITNTSHFQFKPIKLFPSVERDLCLELNQELSYAAIKKALVETTSCFKAIEFSIKPIDFYQSEGSLKKRVTIRLIFSPKNKTLTSKQVEVIVNQIIKNIKSKLDFTLV